MFIKFGQIASTRSDLLPAPVVAELSDLQSNVKLVPVAQIRARIEDELEAPIEEVFGSFSDEPLAAASIGQTHVAELRGGQRVVVKVRRPDVEVGVARDSAVLRWASRAAQRRSEAARSLGLVPLADELIRSVEQELSYVHEAANARALGAVANGDGVAGAEGRHRVQHRRRCWCWIGSTADRCPTPRRSTTAGSARTVLADRLLGRLPHPGDDGRGVPRRPASGQHPDRRRAARCGSSTSVRSA